MDITADIKRYTPNPDKVQNLNPEKTEKLYAKIYKFEKEKSASGNDILKIFVENLNGKFKFPVFICDLTDISAYLKTDMNNSDKWIGMEILIKSFKTGFRLTPVTEQVVE